MREAFKMIETKIRKTEKEQQTINSLLKSEESEETNEKLIIEYMEMNSKK